MELKLQSNVIDNISIIYPDGHINAHTVNDFETMLQNLVTEKKYNILINCHKLEYVSSAGLGAIMGFIEEIRENKGDIKLCGMNENVFNIFDILGFTELYQIFESEEESINAFKG